MYARLKDGVSLEQARTDMDRVGKLLEQQYPDTNRGHGGWAVSLEDRLKTPVRRSLLLLLGAVAFVLLIACVNVANILLAKAAGRRREMAVRAAVGAGRARLAGQMLTESLVLAAARRRRRPVRRVVGHRAAAPAGARRRAAARAVAPAPRAARRGVHRRRCRC